MLISLKQKVVLITGATGGIGKEITKLFSEEGAQIVIHYYHQRKEALALSEELIQKGGVNIALQADLSQKKDVDYLIEESVKHFGHIDILINNAGIRNDNFLIFMSENQWDQVMDVNLKSVFLCSKGVGKYMIKRKRGKIINIASLMGQIGNMGQCNYCAAKAGVIALTKTLAREFGAYGISVNAICPDRICTNMVDEADTKHNAVLNIQTGLKDLLHFLLLLCSDEINGISGQVFNLDSRI